MGLIDIPGKPKTAPSEARKEELRKRYRLSEKVLYDPKAEDVLKSEADEVNDAEIRDIVDNDPDGMECEDLQSDDDDASFKSSSDEGDDDDDDQKSSGSNSSNESGSITGSAASGAQSLANEDENDDPMDIFDLSPEPSESDRKADPSYYKYYDEGRALRKEKKDLTSEMTQISSDLGQLVSASGETFGWMSDKRLSAAASVAEEICIQKAKEIDEYKEIDEKFKTYAVKLEENNKRKREHIKRYKDLVDQLAEASPGTERALELEKQCEKSQKRADDRADNGLKIQKHMQAIEQKRENVKLKVKSYHVVRSLKSLEQAYKESPILQQLQQVKDSYDTLVARASLSSSSSPSKVKVKVKVNRSWRKGQYENIGLVRRRIAQVKKIMAKFSVYKEGVRDWKEFRDNYEYLVDRISSLDRNAQSKSQ